ncbi:hypothetical protein Tco_0760602, partial [Tanacetum coccineum]
MFRSILRTIGYSSYRNTLGGLRRTQVHSVLWGWLFSSPDRIPHGGRGLARSGWFMIAHEGRSGMAIRLGQQMGSCTKPSDEMISCAIKGKLLVLSWGRTPRLDSGVRDGDDSETKVEPRGNDDHMFLVVKFIDILGAFVDLKSEELGQAYREAEKVLANMKNVHTLPGVLLHSLLIVEHIASAEMTSASSPAAPAASNSQLG